MADRFVFVDRDGTMGGLAYLEHPWEYEPYPFTADAFSLLRENGFTVVVITNQACFARGKAGDYDFAAEFRGVGADDWFICPHDTPDGCDCRKPKPGLLYQAQAKYGMDFKNTYMIGDRWSDMVAGGTVGCKLIPVLTCKGPETVGEDREKWAQYEPVYVARDLLDAAKWIAENDAQESEEIRGSTEEHGYCRVFVPEGYSLKHTVFGENDPKVFNVVNNDSYITYFMFHVYPENSAKMSVDTTKRINDGAVDVTLDAGGKTWTGVAYYASGVSCFNLYADFGENYVLVCGAGNAYGSAIVRTVLGSLEVNVTEQ